MGLRLTWQMWEGLWKIQSQSVGRGKKMEKVAFARRVWPGAPEISQRPGMASAKTEAARTASESPREESAHL